jgi:hypothetical protein
MNNKCDVSGLNLQGEGTENDIRVLQRWIGWLLRLHDCIPVGERKEGKRRGEELGRGESEGKRKGRERECREREEKGSRSYFFSPADANCIRFLWCLKPSA